jgi:hypothetical protein
MASLLEQFRASHAQLSLPRRSLPYRERSLKEAARDMEREQNVSQILLNFLSFLRGSLSVCVFSSDLFWT